MPKFWEHMRFEWHDS